jgi:hypothetical protein
VLLPDGTNINHTLVKDGWCCWYRKYAPGNTELERLEPISKSIFDELTPSKASTCSDQATNKRRISRNFVGAASERHAPHISYDAIQAILR